VRSTDTRVARTGSDTFEHVALLYSTDEEYLAGTVPFVREGVESGEAVMVAVPERQLRLLRAATADLEPSGLVTFRSMELMGRNPAWIIPAWADFLGAGSIEGRRARGIGQPIWAERCPEELIECTRHEALLNLAFATVEGFTLLCPYSVTTLSEPVIVGAMRNHPVVCHGAGPRRPSYRYRAHVPPMLSEPLPLPLPGARLRPVAEGVAAARAEARIVAARAGLDRRRSDDFVLSVSEIVTNSMLHTDGGGKVAIWNEDGIALCEVRDHGRITDRLVGRVRPDPRAERGRGLWTVHQLCDLVQIRSAPIGQVVRVHVRNR
jgi:anti-sigma regulatory factor (Ser/Thr protein kinase)